MARLLLNLCVDTETNGVTVVPAGEGLSPTPPPYWFTAYWSQDEKTDPAKGDSFVLARTGPCRLFVWDDEPTEIPAPVGVGSQDTSIRVRLEGAVAILSCGADDPWPRT